MEAQMTTISPTELQEMVISKTCDGASDGEPQLTAEPTDPVALQYKLDRCFVKSWSTSGDADGSVQPQLTSERTAPEPYMEYKLKEAFISGVILNDGDDKPSTPSVSEIVVTKVNDASTPLFDGTFVDPTDPSMELMSGPGDEKNGETVLCSNNLREGGF